MAKLKRFSVQRLNKLSGQYALWCMGCGRCMNEMLSMYEKETFVSKIEKLIDSNCNLWGIEKKSGKNLLKITGKAAFEETGGRKILLIITSNHYREIYEEIASVVRDKRIICTAYPRYYFTYTKYLMKLCAGIPLRRQLLFHAGEEPHENADEIVRFLHNEYTGKKYGIVYAADETENEKEFKTVHYIYKYMVLKKSGFIENMRYCFYYATSSCILYENQPLEKIRRGQKLIYLNHGTVPLKRVNDVLKQRKDVDYAVCPSKGCAQLYREQYGIPESKQIYAMPARVHVLLTHALLDERNDISWASGGKDFVLWLPTFRQLAGTDRRDSGNDDPLAMIQSEEKWILLDAALSRLDLELVIKGHPGEKKKIEIPQGCNHIKIITDRMLISHSISLQILLSQAKALITDYSGVAFEYMLLDRQIGYSISDMDSYVRGFAVKTPLKWMAGAKLKSCEELIRFLEDVKAGVDPYKIQRKQVIKTLFQELAYENGAEILIRYLDEEKL